MPVKYSKLFSGILYLKTSYFIPINIESSLGAWLAEKWKES